MRSNLLERRTLASSHLNETQLKLDATTESFIHEACNIENIAAMTFGSAVFRLTRLGSLSLAKNILNPASNALSYASALSAEVIAFRSANSLFDKLHQRNTTENIFNRDGLLRTFTDFLALKTVGKLAAGQNIFLAHTLQSSAMVASRHLNAKLGLLPDSQGSLLDEFLEAETTNLAMGMGQSLFGFLSGNRLLHLEQSMELGTRSILESRPSFFQKSGSAEFIPSTEMPVMRSEQDLGSLSRLAASATRQTPEECLQRIQEIVLTWFQRGINEAHSKVEGGQAPKLPIFNVLRDARFLGLLPDDIRIRLQTSLDLLSRVNLGASIVRADPKNPKQIYFMSGSADANIQMANTLFRQLAQIAEQPIETWKMESSEVIRRLGDIAIYFKNLVENTEKERDEDFLTGVSNRRALERLTPKIEAALERHERAYEDASGEYWVMMLDGDHFGKINQQYGEANGDRVIIHLAHIARESIRELLGDNVFRLGGEEFIILLKNPGLIGVAQVAQRIKQKLKAMPVLMQLNEEQRASGLSEEVHITVSMGASPLVLLQDSQGRKTRYGAFKAAMENADLAVYQAKERGRNQLVVTGKGTDEYLDEGTLSNLLPSMPSSPENLTETPGRPEHIEISADVRAARAQALSSNPPGPESLPPPSLAKGEVGLLSTLGTLAAQETPQSHPEVLTQIQNIVLGWFHTEMAEAHRQVTQGNIPQLALFKVLRDGRFLDLLPAQVRISLQQALDCIDHSSLTSRPPSAAIERENHIYFMPGSAEKNMEVALAHLREFSQLMTLPVEKWPQDLAQFARHLAGLAYYFKARFETSQKERDRDFLTGLNNNRYLDRLTPKIEATLASNDPLRTREGHLGSYWILVVDGDNFKDVNDTYGHQNGDRVLKNYARIIRESIRELNGDYAFRIVGKKFLILLRSPSIAGVARVAREIQTQLKSNPVSMELSDEQRATEIEAEISPTVSMGAAPLMIITSDSGLTHEGSFRAAWERAEIALERVKNTGKNRLMIAGRRTNQYLDQGEIEDLISRIP